MHNRPLSHIRVLDFGHYLAGPLVGMMLADFGAAAMGISGETLKPLELATARSPSVRMLQLMLAPV